MKKLALIIGGAAVVIGVGVVLFMQDTKINEYAIKGDNKDIQAVGEEVNNLGQKHIKPDDSHDTYNSNPPTSGAHLFDPAPWGVYQTELQDEKLVHNLEHGGIWISYKDVDAEIKTKLETIGKANPGSVIVTPRAKNDNKIAVAAWTRLMKLDSFDEAKILEFIKANKNKSPEPLAK